MKPDLRSIKKLPCAEVIEQIEGLLARAKTGEVSGIVVIQSFSDNCTNHIWSGVQGNAVRITGELTVTASALANHINDDRL